MKVVSVVGARPQFVKLGPVSGAFASVADVEHLVIHTGQHYDATLSDVFFRDLEIPTPDVNLGIGSGSHGQQTGAMLAAIEPVLDAHRPDWVLVYGDTNSTIAATLAAVKLHLPVAHLEAGLRSFNRRMPEEHNRVATDHLADILLAPTDTAVQHLADEGLGARVVNVGDVMADICWRTRDLVRGDLPELPAGVDPAGPYLFATLHRAENTDEEPRLRSIVRALRILPVPVVLAAHPRLVERASTFGVELGGGALHPTAPLGYPQVVRAVMSSSGVVTDSGGLQKEAFLLGVPCTTLRAETEWVETLQQGWNVLDPEVDLLRDVALRAAPREPQGQPFGDGRAAFRVVSELVAPSLNERVPSGRGLDAGSPRPCASPS